MASYVSVGPLFRATLCPGGTGLGLSLSRPIRSVEGLGHHGDPFVLPRLKTTMICRL
jgi:hypothetical protein